MFGYNAEPEHSMQSCIYSTQKALFMCSKFDCDYLIAI